MIRPHSFLIATRQEPRRTGTPCSLFYTASPLRTEPSTLKEGGSFRKFASTRIVTEDVAALAAFYQQIAGVAPVGNDDFVEVRTAGAVLAICSRRSVDQDNAEAAVAGTNRSVILEFEVADVDAERERLGSEKIEWVQEPTTQPWGNRSMLFRDPDGNLVNLYTPPRR